jgi:hypothetical protein
MSQQLISHNPDLKRLRDEGHDVEVRSGYLLVKHVPYVNSNKEVKFGVLVSELDVAGDLTTVPKNHTVYFSGDHPCDRSGAPLTRIVNQSVQKTLDPDIVVHHYFSSKPTRGSYKDHYEKMVTYMAIVSSPAYSLDPDVTAKTFPVIATQADESVFNYLDTASSRAEIGAITKRLEVVKKVGLVGLGGTGSYILDLVAKTPVREIHLFDGDKFSQHNAFRSPGAPSVDELKGEIWKVMYFREIYSKMHRNIIAHNCFIDASNIDLLQGMDFVFLCLDRGEAKKLIVEKLEEFSIPFIDVGMGVQLVDNSLLGVLRITASTNQKRDHIKNKARIPFSDGDGNNDYSRNIQIADLNALNAALAVIKWKKLVGIYRDLENEHFSTYTIDGNVLINEDQL